MNSLTINNAQNVLMSCSIDPPTQSIPWILAEAAKTTSALRYSLFDSTVNEWRLTFFVPLKRRCQYSGQSDMIRFDRERNAMEIIMERLKGNRLQTKRNGVNLCEEQKKWLLLLKEEVFDLK